MSEFTEDWSLHAVVQGPNGEYSRTFEAETNEEGSIFNFANDQDFLTGIFPEIFTAPATAGSLEDLEDLYKPFYQAPPPPHALPHRTVLDFQERNNNSNPDDDDPKQGPDLSDHSSGSIGSGSVSMLKHKRRKNQHKRVVIQVSADGLSSDMWAWRKYGQKPIKGSPYPRSYYRCSSSKGCLARKQLEQSRSDPGKFTVTYSGEHNHTQPTRRNSLAGTVRQKFPSTKNHDVAYKPYKRESNKTLKRLGSSSAAFPSRRIKEENYGPENGRFVNDDEEKDDDFVMSETFFGDDFFSGLEEFDFFNMKNTPSLRSCR